MLRPLHLGSLLLALATACNSPSHSNGTPPRPPPRPAVPAPPVAAPAAAVDSGAPTQAAPAAVDGGAPTQAAPAPADGGAPTTATPTTGVDSGAPAPTAAAPVAAPTAAAETDASAPADVPVPEVFNSPARTTVSAPGLRIIWMRNGMVHLIGNNTEGQPIQSLYQDCAHFRDGIPYLRLHVTPAQAAILPRVCPAGAP